MNINFYNNRAIGVEFIVTIKWNEFNYFFHLIYLGSRQDYIPLPLGIKAGDLLNSKIILWDGSFLEAGIQYRNATIEECRDIAEFYSIALDGVADYVWNTLRDPGEST